MTDRHVLARLANDMDDSMMNLLDSIHSYLESGALEHVEAILTDLELTEDMMRRIRNSVKH